MIEQKVIPSISTMRNFEKFLHSDFVYCVLLDFHVALLGGMLAQLHQHHKKGIVHLDLVKGLSSDEHGCAYLCQQLKCDGVISTKGKVIETAKKNKKIAILRLFLIDSKSLEKGLLLTEALTPDYLEVLPAIAYSIIPYMQSKTKVPLIGGGLIHDMEVIEACLQSGMCALTVGDYALCMEYHA